MSKSIVELEQDFYNHFLKMDKNSYGLIKIWKYLEEHVFSQFKESQPTEVVDLSNFKEPELIKAGDTRVIVNGYPLSVDFRIIAEDGFQKLLKAAQQPTEVERMKWVKVDLENKFKELYSQSLTAINQMNIGVGQMTTRDKLKAHENAVWEFIEWLDSTPNTQADEDVIREHLISFLMDIDECYAMHIRENAERCVDEYLANNTTPKEEDVEKMAEEILSKHLYIEESFTGEEKSCIKRAMIEMYNAAKTTK
jgi:hypothetical protein